MTRAQKIAKAGRLSAQGLTHGQIAARFKVTRSCVSKWLNPEAAKEYARRDNARPERHQQKRAVARLHTRDCVDCGKTLGEGTAWGYKKKTQRCRECFKRHEYETGPWPVLIRLWAEGKTCSEIAEALDTTKAYVGVLLARGRAYGYDLPHRRTPEQVERIRAGWEKARERRAA